MAEYVIVNVFCPNPKCEFRGKASAQSFVQDESTRRCPDCGWIPLRIEVPGRAGSEKPKSDTMEARSNP